jgi:predicted PurR-regulated permease PerM
MQHLSRALTYRRETAFLLCALVFLILMGIGFVIPLFSGFLFFTLVSKLAEKISVLSISVLMARFIASAIIIASTVLIIFSVGKLADTGLKDGVGLKALGDQMGDVITSAREWLPKPISAMLPEANMIFLQAGSWVHLHVGDISIFGFNAVKQVGYALLGMIIGVMISCSTTKKTTLYGPFSVAIVSQISALCGSFWNVAMAQITISAVNTFFTGIYLLVVLPLLGVHLGMAKGLVVATFILGLIPIVGNLISNSVITIVSLSYSMPVAIGSLSFLVVIHKFEYFMNAAIVGSRINAKAWEILLAMVLMERVFGVAGIFAAPIFYAWLKAEWHVWDRVVVSDQIALHA